MTISLGRASGGGWGFSLIEVLMVAALFGVISAALFGVLRTSSVNNEILSSNSDQQKRLLIALDRLGNELKQGNIITFETLNTNVPMIEYQLPVDPDGDGSVVNDTTGEIDWGVPGDGPAGEDVLGNSITVTFEAQEDLSEATLKYDLNNDGDLSDTLKKGRLYRTTTNGGRNNVTVCADVLLSSSPYDRDLDPKFDSDADGTASEAEDALFSRTTDGSGFTTSITVNLWLFNRNYTGKSFKNHGRTTFFMRNKQS